MDKLKDFKWKHFQPDIILLCVRWYLRYSLYAILQLEVSSI